jgi:hypothetical protein
MTLLHVGAHGPSLALLCCGCAEASRTTRVRSYPKPYSSKQRMATGKSLTALIASVRCRIDKFHSFSCKKSRRETLGRPGQDAHLPRHRFVGMILSNQLARCVCMLGLQQLCGGRAVDEPVCAKHQPSTPCHINSWENMSTRWVAMPELVTHNFGRALQRALLMHISLGSGDSI